MSRIPHSGRLSTMATMAEDGQYASGNPKALSADAGARLSRMWSGKARRRTKNSSISWIEICPSPLASHVSVTATHTASAAKPTLNMNQSDDVDLEPRKITALRPYPETSCCCLHDGWPHCPTIATKQAQRFRSQPCIAGQAEYCVQCDLRRDRSSRDRYQTLLHHLTREWRCCSDPLL